jgi:hypothetical protein
MRFGEMSRASGRGAAIALGTASQVIRRIMAELYREFRAGSGHADDDDFDMNSASRNVGFVVDHQPHDSSAHG